MVDYRNRRVVILGLGKSGLSCVYFFINRGVNPRVMDSRESPAGAEHLPDWIEHRFGEIDSQWLLDADLIVVSPGIALFTPPLKMAAAAGIEIVGDIELFVREVTVPIVAITGSNGKSTVTDLLGEMAKASGVETRVGGNIGEPVLNLLSEEAELYVIELSSFQLETTHSLHAAVATVLNVSEDHMDRYPEGMAQYQAAKLRIYQNASTCVINADDGLTLPTQAAQRNCISFGLNVGDYHLNIQQGKTWLKAYGEKLLEGEQIQLKGQHNLINALAALALADAINLPRANCLAALKYYQGLSHRFQLVHQAHGISWINDSKATNVGSTIAALRGLTPKGRLWLLLGGDGKSADFSALIPWLQGDAIKIYTFGKDADQLSQLRPEVSKQVTTMQQAISLICPQLQAGDTVLLSPACASLDQFKNFEQRGEMFTQLAKESG